jgi:ubiquinone/menaquinone biosynthesis C-methylase UbiE
LPKGHRIFAALYDRMLDGTERAGLSEMRAQVVGRAEGRTLELGAGTGLNLRHYSDAVTELVLTEPDPFMANRLRERIAREPPAPATVELAEVSAEDLPFDDQSFDTVVATLVFCTIPDPTGAAREARRVLTVAGRVLYLEHVRDPNEGSLARWQDRLARPWGWVTGGCHPNRSTAAILSEGGFELEPEHGRMPKAPPWVRPLIRGSASLPG